MKRRTFVKLSGVAAGSLFVSGCKDEAEAAPGGPVGPATARSPARPQGTGRVQEVRLKAGPVTVEAPDGPFDAFGYEGGAPGPEIRVTEGDTLRVVVENGLPEETTIHWHGLPVPNPMDGVPELTQAPIPAGGTFVYEFLAWPAGTYVYHSHVGYQLDQGLYGPLVVEPRQGGDHDREYVLVLEDWATVDGAGPAAAAAGDILDRGGMGGMMGGPRGGMGPMGGMMGGPRGGVGPMGGRMGGGRGAGPPWMRGGAQPTVTDAEGTPLYEPRYDAWSVNGKLTGDGERLEVRRGDRVRLRLINASSGTIHLFRVAGHTLTVTHADGRPVEPVEVDAVRLGMGERYDVELTADNPGRWRLLDRPDTGGGVVTLGELAYAGATGSGFSGEGAVQGRILGYDQLRAVDEPDLPSVGPEVDRVFPMVLSGGMHSPYWTINGEVYPETGDLTIRPGERVRLEFSNRSTMPHPMHLHGHFFELDLPGRPRKDTVIVEAHMGRMAVEFVADNPGDWFHHCHNLYHLMGGMANVARIG